MKDLEAFLREPDSLEKEDVFKKIQEEYDIMKEPEVFISRSDKFFMDVMSRLKESEKSTDASYSIKPLFNDDFEVDGVYVSFSKKF